LRGRGGPISAAGPRAEDRVAWALYHRLGAVHLVPFRRSVTAVDRAS